MQVDPGNYLRVMTASTGSLQKAIPGLAMTPRKTLLSPSGSYAYVMASNGGDYKGALVAVVDLTSDAVVAYIQVAGGLPFDIAVSPDGTKLYVANESPSGAVAKDKPMNGATSSCPTGNTICVFSTSTYALLSQIKGVFGWLAVSQDSSTLYTWLGNPYYLAINTSTLATSGIGLPSGFYPQAMAIAPSGSEAVLSTASSTATAFFILNTSTNKITGTFPAPAASGLWIGSTETAFSSDGTSLRTLGGCASDFCSTLYGQSFPSGQLICATPISGFSTSEPYGIAF
jgi:DNA-binding beta-propeller fold protein YncE